MPVVVSFNGWEPPSRYDGIPWTEARIEESDAEAGTYTQIDVYEFDELDADPSDPEPRSFSTEFGTAVSYWYRLIFADADGDVAIPTVPVQNTVGANIYATTTDLARILKIRAPTADQTADMQRVLTVAAAEIDAEVDLSADDGIEPWMAALMEEVNLERAVEHWKQLESAFGLIVIGVDAPAERSGLNSWERHALKLAPMKRQWGFA